MSKLDRHTTAEGSANTPGNASIGATPGKRTLVEGVPPAPPSSPVQRRAGATNDDATGTASGVHAAAAGGIAGSSQPLPYAGTLQGLFGGHDLGNIEAHTDEAASAGARAMGARAFATGNHIAFGSTPDLHTAAHEAAHVVQQRAGVQLSGGVGESGDAYERNADAVADRVVRGQPAGDLLPVAAETGGSTVQRTVQRQSSDQMTSAQLRSAHDWMSEHPADPDTIRQVQARLGVAESGVFDDALAQRVYTRQKEMRVGADGILDPNFCHQIGIVFTHPIVGAAVSDPVLEQIKVTFPRGVTVAVYAAYGSMVADRREFRDAANTFAASENAVGMPGTENQGTNGLSGGALAMRQACPIQRLGDVIEVVQSIHRGLVEKWRSSQATSATALSADAAPAYTKILNLAIFTHGESYGIGLNNNNDFWEDGLRNRDRESTVEAPAVNPSNVESFVRGLHDAIQPNVRVLLYGCSAGAGPDAEGNARGAVAETRPQAEGDLAGRGSLASSLTQLLGPQATVMAHSTDGHVTGNHSARVFGAEAGSDAGVLGIPLFELMYPETYIQDQLRQLYPGVDPAVNHDRLRAAMFAHFENSVHDLAGQRRYNVDPTRDEFSPMGREMFIHPERARERLHRDWEANWATFVTPNS